MKLYRVHSIIVLFGLFYCGQVAFANVLDTGIGVIRFQTEIRKPARTL